LLHHNKQIITAKPLNFNHKLTSAQLFSHLSDKPWAMWLDSCQSDHVDSHYDIIVWQPEITLITQGDITTIDYCSPEQSDNQRQQSTEDPIELLQKLQGDFFKTIEIEPQSLPFLTGAVGYCSYDLGRRFEKLPSHAIKDINIPEMAMGIYSQAIVLDKTTQQFQLICSEQKRASLEKLLISTIDESATPARSPFKLTNSWQSNMSALEYQHKFEQIQQYLLSGDCYQINLTQRFTSQYHGDEFNAYLALREQNQAPFSAFIRLHDHAILSISPERFVQVCQDKVQSKPIKGTMVRSLDKLEDENNANLLKNSNKDKAENLMIVDLLRNDISKVCTPGSVKVPHLFNVESFPAVHHLVSTVEGTLSPEYDSFDLLKAAFPGGSITGAPKIRAMEIIDELEPQRRSIYCGSIGYISACGNMDSNITIRTLVCQNSNIHCWAGGGIVADSQVDAEYQESLDKVNKILPILEGI